jgi:hypothetical protein
MGTHHRRVSSVLPGVLIGVNVVLKHTVGISSCFSIQIKLKR